MTDYGKQLLKVIRQIHSNSYRVIDDGAVRYKPSNIVLCNLLEKESERLQMLISDENKRNIRHLTKISV